MKKNTYTKKLAAYSALTTGLLSLGNSIEAQIIYTDIDPDIALTDVDEASSGDMAEIDFNDDGFIDLEIYWSEVYWCEACFHDDHLKLNFNSLQIDMAIGIAPAISTSSCYFSPAAQGYVFGYGDIINSDFMWGDLIEVFNDLNCGSSSSPIGFWQGFFEYGSFEEDQFLGFRTTAKDTNYCWLRLDWVDMGDPKNILFVKDYACNSEDQQPIVVGDAGTVNIFPQIIKDHLILYPNPAQNSLFINADEFSAPELKIDVYNIHGENVKTFIIENVDELQIDISHLATGIYTLNLADNEKSVSQKFVKQ